MSSPWRWFLALTLVAVAPAPAAGQDQGPHSGTVWWGGYAGTGFWVDREARAIGVFMIQNVNEPLHSSAFRSRVYASLGR